MGVCVGFWLVVCGPQCLHTSSLISSMIRRYGFGHPCHIPLATHYHHKHRLTVGTKRRLPSLSLVHCTMPTQGSLWLLWLWWCYQFRNVVYKHILHIICEMMSDFCSTIVSFFLSKNSQSDQSVKTLFHWSTAGGCNVSRNVVKKEEDCKLVNMDLNNAVSK